jgi:hypothetical protein
MSENKLTYEDMKRYEFVLTKVPSILLGTMIRRNANLVGKFQSTIVSRLDSLNELQEKQLDIILNSDVSEIQKLMKEAYDKSGKKQYEQLANPKATKFIEKNIEELKKIVNKE